jgi:hypothetical protein
MRVYTFYEPINAETPGTMQVWKESWAHHGWEPVVLGVEDFKQHPAWEFYDAATDKLPTFNNRIYERACYRRWMAMGPVGGGLMTDYDVLNRGFIPSDLNNLDLSELSIMCEDRVPCVVFGTGHQYLRAALEFARYVPDERDVYRGHDADPYKGNNGKQLVEDMTILRRHTSDMNIVGRAEPHPWFVERYVCCDYRHYLNNPKGYARTPLVHFSAYGTHGLNRTAVMRKMMK